MFNIKRLCFSTRLTILLTLLIGLLIVYSTFAGAGETWWDKSERRLYQDEGPGGGTNGEDSYNLLKERHNREQRRNLNPC